MKTTHKGGIVHRTTLQDVIVMRSSNGGKKKQMNDRKRADIDVGGGDDIEYRD
jgi:hypothetical protein